MYEDNSHYVTSDSALAAYLHCIGVELLSVKAKDGHGVFVFKKNDISDIGILADNFKKKRATVVALFYYQSYRTMLEMVKEAIRENDGRA